MNTEDKHRVARNYLPTRADTTRPIEHVAGTEQQAEALWEVMVKLGDKYGWWELDEGLRPYIRRTTLLGMPNATLTMIRIFVGPGEQLNEARTAVALIYG